ncbi:MAG: hypothetical protein HEP71_31725 [Roseivirga sp.]|nr:hypothetical protein [Roseivirga sp.]
MLTFKTYADQEVALSELTYLRQNGIEANLAQSHDNGILTFQLEVAEKDLETSQLLLKREDLSTTNEDSNFMADYNDQELKDIIINQVDYGQAMVDNARAVLLERNPQIDFSEIEQTREMEFANRLSKQQQGLRARTSGIVAAYIFALMGGIIGLGAGWFIQTGKTLAVDGNKYYTYDQHSRKHGERIKWLGIVSLIFWTLFEHFFNA